MPDPNPTPDAQVILDAGKQLGRPNYQQGYAPYALVPVGMELKPLTREDPAPLLHIRQKPSFRDLVSFITYCNRFLDERTQLFADERKGTIIAVMDYHTCADSDLEADRCDHVATFTAEHTPEWREWTARNGKAMTQDEFARWIEDQAPFIARPDAATMLEIATQMSGTTTASFSRATNLANGQVQLHYVENIEGRVGPKGEMDIPKSIDVLLAPFIGTSPRKVEARFRWRIEGGRLSMWYDLFRIEDVIRLAFDAMIQKTRDEVAVELYVGSPGPSGT